MLHGKKGFERIVWAFKNVLNYSVTWLFHDFDEDASSRREEKPIAKHHPTNHTVLPRVQTTADVLIPPLHPPGAAASSEEFEEWSTETYEYLSLVSLQCPRILAGDSINPFLSRYQVPGGETEEHGEEAKLTNMILLRWRGFIPATWIRSLFVILWSVFLSFACFFSKSFSS